MLRGPSRVGNLPPAVSEVRKYLPEIYKLPVCLGLQSGGGEEEKRREHKPNIEVGKKVQWAEKI